MVKHQSTWTLKPDCLDLNLSSPLTSWVTLGKLLTFLMLQLLSK